TQGGTPWNIELDRLAIRKGLVHLDDRVASPAEPLELVLDSIDLRGFTLEHEPDREPAVAALAARFGSGTLRIGADIDRRPDGFYVAAKLDAGGLPLDRLYLHQPGIGWSQLVGRFDASVRAQVTPAGQPTAQGTVALRDVAVSVPGGGDPVLAW